MIGSDLASVLDLERLDRDLFRGLISADTTARPSIYGGQVAAQALLAAGLTVDDARLPHSMHGYFLRAGSPQRPVIYQVTRTRDGRSFSARHVVAMQEGKAIFELLASFHVNEESAELEFLDRAPVEFPDDAAARGHEKLLEVREITNTRHEGDDPIFSDLMWVRSAHPLPDDPLVHACALAYISDLGSGFGQMRHPGLGRGGTSIDHSIWFHSPIRVDDWVLIDMWPLKARSARGVYHGSMSDRSGTLGAMFSQEALMRPGPIAAPSGAHSTEADA